MIKQVLYGMDYSIVAEAALVMFIIAFGLATLQALLRKSSDIEEVARLPLDDCDR